MRTPIAVLAAASAVVLLATGNFASGEEDIPPADRTPYTCGAKTVAWHIGHSAKNARRAWDPVTKQNRERFLKAKPFTSWHLRVGRFHRGCVTWPAADRRMIQRWRTEKAQFNGYYIDQLSPPGQGWLASTRACESTNDPRAHDPSGTYHGWYQFDMSSWAGAGGSGDPHLASKREQSYRAAVWYRMAGSGAWPNCG